MCFQKVIKYEDEKKKMNYLKEMNDLEEIFKEINKNNYKFGLLFCLNGVFLDEAEKVKNKLDENNFIEARFFDAKKELFVFYDGEKYKAVLTNKNEWKKDRICRPYILDGKFQEKDYLKNSNIKYIKVIEFIGYDEDGQAYVKATCLDGVE